jgi:hypothetical protein
MLARDGRLRDNDERCWEIFGREWARSGCVLIRLMRALEEKSVDGHVGVGGADVEGDVGPLDAPIKNNVQGEVAGPETNQTDGEPDSLSLL